MELRFRHALAALTLALTPAIAVGQGVVQGHVTAETGNPLASASVVIQGTRIGGLTGPDGRYSFPVPAAQANGQVVTITARLIGYRAKSVQVKLTAGTIDQDFVLATSPVQLTGMIITAEGQVKQKSQLGTAAQQITSEQLNAAPTANFQDALGAKVSGLQVTSPGTQGGSVKMTIRGSSSIAGNNDPLYVIDGVPVSNRNRGGNPNGGWDYGSSISDLNPDDIASITVLKGPNAAALYGSNAANGAIVITTKHGGASEGQIRTTLSTSYSFDKVGILPDFQNSYGQGSAGQFRYVNGAGKGVCDGCDQSYGPRLNTDTLIDQFTGPQQPWVSHPDNVSSFFNTGGTFDANLAVNGGNDRANARMSVGVQNVNGVVPNNFMHKWTSAIGGQLKVGDKFDASASFNFSRNGALNRAGTGYNAGILEGLTVWFGRQVDMAALKAHYQDFNQFGDRYNWNTNYHSNPYFLQYMNPESDTRNQYIGSVQGTYHFFDWLSSTARFGGNLTQLGIQQDVASQNTSWQGAGLETAGYGGAFSLFNNTETEYTAELLFNAQKKVTSKLELNGLLGFSKNRDQYNSNSQQTLGILVPGIYNITNAAIAPTLAQNLQQSQTNSVFGSASFTWNGFWTVEGTARNDWASTLPQANNSYFYPSVNTSLVLTDAIPELKSHTLTYLKIRGSIAQVGNSATPYQTLTTYNGSSSKFDGISQYSLSDALANQNLKPEITKAQEAGLEVGLFGDRVSLDASYYHKSTRNQILSIPVSPSTGFSTKAINAGEIVNKGFEALLNVTPVRLSNGFEWNSTFSFNKNTSKVASLYPGIQTIVLGSAWYTNIEARAGDPYGAIYGNSFLRDDNGKLITVNGQPQPGPLQVLGNIQPDWIGGWTNEFRYKHVSLSGTFDIRQGGDIFSITNYFGANTGTLAFTMNGRQVAWNNPGIVVDGVNQDGTPNTTRVTSEQYYQSLFHIAQPFIYDDSYIKLRELRLGFDMPQSLTAPLHVTTATISVYGRNLWTHTKVPNIDPEFAYSSGNSQGIEFAELPNPKSFGFALQVTP